MKQSPMKSALEMTFNGVVVGAISYLMGWILSVCFPMCILHAPLGPLSRSQCSSHPITLGGSLHILNA